MGYGTIYLLPYQVLPVRCRLADQTIDKSSAVAEMGDRLATIDMGRKVGKGCCMGCAGSPLGHHLTIWPGPRLTSLPIGILIHPTVWPQL